VKEACHLTDRPHFKESSITNHNTGSRLRMQRRYNPKLFPLLWSTIMDTDATGTEVA
jgi:hypothetical protein